MFLDFQPREVFSMKINKTTRAFFAELTKNSDRYEFDGSFAKLKVKGEHRISLWLHKDDVSPFRSTLYFRVDESLCELFSQIVGDRYRSEVDQNGNRQYLVLDTCFNAKEFIETALEALSFLDKTVMVSRMAIECDIREK